MGGSKKFRGNNAASLEDLTRSIVFLVHRRARNDLMSSVDGDEVVSFSINGKDGGEMNGIRRQFNERQTRSGWKHLDIAGATFCNHACGLALDIYRVKMNILTRVRGGGLWFASRPDRAGSRIKVAVQTACRKKLRNWVVFTVSKGGAQRKSRYRKKT